MDSQVRRTHSPFHPVAQKLVVVLPLFMFLFTGFPATAQDTTGVGGVIGIVGDDGRKPAPQVKVCIAETTHCVLTDVAGRFRLTGLRAGHYRLQVTSGGHPAQLSTEFEVHAGVETSVEFSLAALTAIEQTVTVTATTQSLPEEIKTSGFFGTCQSDSGQRRLSAGRFALLAISSRRVDGHRGRAKRLDRPRRESSRELIRR